VLRPTVRPHIYEAYWHLAAERHRIFQRRLGHQPGPWTSDPILARHRFCNSFRAADRVTQHLIQHAGYGAEGLSEADIFLRVVLHRLFSKPSTWDLLNGRVGRIDVDGFSQSAYGEILDEAFERGEKLYTGAFILCANAAYGHPRKHRNHLALLDAMLTDSLAGRIAGAPSLKAVYEELRGWPLIGPFMAYQLAIDLNYTELLDFSEDDFTIPGPGALRGISKVFVDLGEMTPSGAIHWLVEQQATVEYELGIPAPDLFGRPLHAIDCQNLLCELDKYCREAFPELGSNRSRIKQRFRPDPSPMPLFFPPRWDINENVPEPLRANVNDPAPV
jgi:hypothetical protein